MKALKVNADYESVLFGGASAPPAVNQSIEFLAFFLEQRPLLTAKNYSKEYLDHVEEISGHRPHVVHKGDYENWWGALKDIPLERKLNSKELSSEFSSDSVLIYSLEEILLETGKSFLAKSPFSMSGQNFLTFKKGEEEALRHLLKKAGKLLIEPLLPRRFDFSHYLFPDNKMICYENLVDEKFQYKGTLFTDLNHADASHLRFYNELSESCWNSFKVDLEKIVSTYREEGAVDGFSLDSFIYEEGKELRIRHITEVNYRRTMGMTAWLLANKYGQGKTWSLFILGKNLKKEQTFHEAKRLTNSLEGCLYLSPGDSRFEIFLLSADSPEAGKKLFQNLKKLLPYTQFPVEL